MCLDINQSEENMVVEVQKDDRKDNKENRGEHTRFIERVNFKNERLEEIIRVTKIKILIDKAYKIFDNLKEELGNNDWIKMKDEQVYYEQTQDMLVPNVEVWTDMSYKESNLPIDYNGVITWEFYTYLGICPNKNEAKIILKKFGNKINYIANSDKYWLDKNGKNMIFNGSDRYERMMFYTSKNYYEIPIIPIKRMGIKDNILYGLLEKNLTPVDLSSTFNTLFKNLKWMYSNNYLLKNGSKIIYNSKFEEDVFAGKIKSLNGVDFTETNSIFDEELEITKDLKSQLYEIFLKCDYIRAEIEPYDEKWLEDPNMGHWDLWTPSSEGIKLKLKEKIVARNPLCDIRENGIIGIDFGTKSTIVVCQDGDDTIQPMRVGMGRFSKKVEAKHFENPTVMEFRNLQSFLTAYRAKAGRPETQWEDMTVSHTAFNDLMESKSNDYYTYFNDLKQWTDEKNTRIRIKDKKGYEYELKSYLSLTDEDFDPIEYYAYYIGLFINNMHNGIYMDYLLSFPVTYEVAVRERILKSFSRGIKKSLPEEVLNDEESMKLFRVAQGASEPAAYAICALEQYGFDPEDEEKVFYGIFDFGGGTTDFDFGIWRSADENEDRYDYVINHFGAGGDKYLGGENLLKLLAFNVFVDNQDNLRRDGISFQKPEECKKFPGSEVLLSESQEAKLNMKQLMEKLRPLWERTENSENLFSNGEISVLLFDKRGELKSNYTLAVDKEKLEQILSDRIEQGVRNFFESLKLTFAVNNSEVKGMLGIEIFLAGNSSKSPIVREIFDQYIEKHTQMINENSDSEKENYYRIYPPLGTREAMEIQKERGIEVEEEDLTKPTGKTGVAFGLIEGRSGGMIKVISERDTSKDEIKFAYYIGRNRKKKFKPILSREIEYKKWVKFISAESTDFELYITELPESITGNLAINQTNKIKGRVPVANADAWIYIRAVAPTKIEYVEATEEGIQKEEYLCEIMEKELN